MKMDNQDKNVIKRIKMVVSFLYYINILISLDGIK